MPKLTDTRAFYPEITGLQIVDICEQLTPFTAFEQAQAWQVAHNTGMDSWQGFYGRTMHHLLSIGLITHRENEDQHRKVYVIEWDTDDEVVNLPKFSPALFLVPDDIDENDPDDKSYYWDRACNYLTDITDWCISGISYVPSISEGDETDYYTHDFDVSEVKEYIDLGDKGVLLIVDDYIVGCEGKALFVRVDREYDEPRGYITIDDTIHYLDTMKSIPMDNIEVING